jgi:hypothetical protein
MTNEEQNLWTQVYLATIAKLPHYADDPDVIACEMADKAVASLRARTK